MVAHHYSALLPPIRAAVVATHCGSGAGVAGSVLYGLTATANVSQRAILARMTVLGAGALCEALLGREPEGCESDLGLLDALGGDAVSEQRRLLVRDESEAPARGDQVPGVSRQ